jgi:xylanolytic transcriptional activator XlnR
MSMTSLQSFADSYSPFLPRSQPTRMSQSQTPGLDTLAEGSQYALEELQLARQAGASSQPPTDLGHNHNAPGQTDARHLHSYNEENDPQISGKMSLQQRDMLAEARSTIRKNSTAGPVRRRISRACDQCNQLRTKCDGQQPCAHCLGT